MMRIKMSNTDTLALAKELVAEMAELIEDRKMFESDDLDGYYDYLGGLIDTRGVIVGRLGYNELLNNLEWTDC
jgi:hypothetical protein